MVHMELSHTARALLTGRYLLPRERPSDMFRRVAEAVDTGKAGKFFSMMKTLFFLPNSPTLMNAGTPGGQLSACFVLPVEDSIEGIFKTLGTMARIHTTGGGTGFSFSGIRPSHDQVAEKTGVASGPLPFIRVFDEATNALKQGGRRRGANMGVLSSSHPDIRDFIMAKQLGGLGNFNLSVGFDEQFFRCLSSGREYELINPRNGDIWDTVSPGYIWDLIAHAAWSSGDPGMLFLDLINEKNPVPDLGSIEATNPCGEQPLLPFESCNLGSINLDRCIRKGDLDFELLKSVTRLSVEFLDSVIDVNSFPTSEIRRSTLLTRKIGLGVMGLADALIRLSIPYSSPEAVDMTGRIMNSIQTEAKETSRELGEKKGSFPAIEKSMYQGEMRNATVTTVAPTGSLHLIANTSSGIEPVFSLVYQRIINGKVTILIHPYIKEFLMKERSGIDILGHIRRTGSIQELPLPEEIRELFRTAQEIPPVHHVKMQAMVQRYVDNAVSKTVNLPESITVGEVSRIFSLARESGCKGITVYRYNSKSDQALLYGCHTCSTCE